MVLNGALPNYNLVRCTFNHHFMAIAINGLAVMYTTIQKVTCCFANDFSQAFLNPQVFG